LLRIFSTRAKTTQPPEANGYHAVDRLEERRFTLGNATTGSQKQSTTEISDLFQAR
jgi:hypothetical protein